MLNRWEMGILLLAPLVFGGIMLAGWHFSPAVRERSLEVGLAIGPHPVKKYAAGALRNYPTRDAALGLVTFINLNNPAAPVIRKETDGGSLSGEARRALEAEQEAEVERRRELGEAALISLCELSGQSFGTPYEKNGSNYTWGSPSIGMWPSVISQVNGWALGAFGPGLLASAASEPGGGVARDLRVVFQGGVASGSADEASP